MEAVALHNIKKTYNDGTVVAVADISLSIEKGELFGMIGPDGAGKTFIVSNPYNIVIARWR